MKMLLGYTLVALPIVVIFALIFVAHGASITLIVLLSVAFTIASVVAGVFLIEDY